MAPKKITEIAEITDEPSPENTPMFTMREEDTCFVLTLNNLSQSENVKRQQKIVCQRVPSLLREKRNLTARELEAVGWSQAGRKPHVLEAEIGSKTVRYPFLRLFDEEEIQGGNCWRKFERMQRIATDVDFQARLSKMSRKKTHTHELSFSVQPGLNRKKSLQLSLTGKADDDEFKEMRELAGDCARSIVLSAFEVSCPDFADMLLRRWCLDASMTVGCEENFAVSGLQMNFTSLDSIDEEAGTSKGLGDFGRLHMDGLDDPGRMTVILNLSHLPKTYYPGRFNITTARITITAAPFTAIVFRGTHPHFATGFGRYDSSLPLNSPLRYSPAGGIKLPTLPAGTPYKRIVPVAYPKEVLMRPRERYLRAILFSSKAVDTFGSKRAMQEWRMRMFLREEFKNLPKGTEPSDVCEAFAYINEDGLEDRPRLWIAETIFDWAGVKDKAWEDANTIASICSIGKKFARPMISGQVKYGSEVWTDGDLDLPFDPETDWIPANRNWIPVPRVQDVPSRPKALRRSARNRKQA